MKFVLSPTDRLAVIREIEQVTGYANWVIEDSGRTDAQLVALARDAPYCQWHLHNDVLRPLHDVHHLLGRLDSQDWPGLCIGLCRECHRRVEDKRGDPTDFDLLRLMVSRLPTLESMPLPFLLPTPLTPETLRQILQADQSPS